MTEQEYVLITIASEAGSVAKQCNKAMCLGLTEAQKRRLWSSVFDLQASLEIYMEHNGGGDPDRKAVSAKKASIRKLLLTYEKLGTVTRESGNFAG